MYRFTLSRIKSKDFLGRRIIMVGADSSGVSDVSDEFSQESILYNKEIADISASDLFGDPTAVVKIFIVGCATDSYEMYFCGTVPQIVVNFDLLGSKCGTKTASFYRS